MVSEPFLKIGSISARRCGLFAGGYVSFGGYGVVHLIPSISWVLPKLPHLLRRPQPPYPKVKVGQPKYQQNGCIVEHTIMPVELREDATLNLKP